VFITARAEDILVPVHACRIYLGANQAGIVSGTHTKINFDTVDFDTDGMADVATNHRITPKVAGTYLVSAALDNTASNLSGLAICSIAKNGTRISLAIQQVSSTNLEVGLGKTDFVNMNGTTDFLEVQAFLTTSAGTATVQAGITLSHLSVARIGP
jgi:hypothetical protein